jgi:hypothetical protein
VRCWHVENGRCSSLSLGWKALHTLGLGSSTDADYSTSSNCCFAAETSCLLFMEPMTLEPVTVLKQSFQGGLFDVFPAIGGRKTAYRWRGIRRQSGCYGWFKVVMLYRDEVEWCFLSKMRSMYNICRKRNSENYGGVGHNGNRNTNTINRKQTINHLSLELGKLVREDISPF